MGLVYIYVLFETFTIIEHLLRDRTGNWRITCSLCYQIARLRDLFMRDEMTLKLVSIGFDCLLAYILLTM